MDEDEPETTVIVRRKGPVKTGTLKSKQDFGSVRDIHISSAPEPLAGFPPEDTPIYSIDLDKLQDEGLEQSIRRIYEKSSAFDIEINNYGNTLDTEPLSSDPRDHNRSGPFPSSNLVGTRDHLPHVPLSAGRFDSSIVHNYAAGDSNLGHVTRSNHLNPKVSIGTHILTIDDQLVEEDAPDSIDNVLSEDEEALKWEIQQIKKGSGAVQSQEVSSTTRALVEKRMHAQALPPLPPVSLEKAISILTERQSYLDGLHLNVSKEIESLDRHRHECDQKISELENKLRADDQVDRCQRLLSDIVSHQALVGIIQNEHLGAIFNFGHQSQSKSFGHENYHGMNNTDRSILNIPYSKYKCRTIDENIVGELRSSLSIIFDHIIIDRAFPMDALSSLWECPLLLALVNWDPKIILKDHVSAFCDAILPPQMLETDLTMDELLRKFARPRLSEYFAHLEAQGELMAIESLGAGETHWVKESLNDHLLRRLNQCRAESFLDRLQMGDT